MVIKKLPEKKPLVKKSPRLSTVHPLRREKASPMGNTFSYLLTILLTVAVLLIIEMVYSVPSTWLHTPEERPGVRESLPTKKEKVSNICPDEVIQVCGKDKKTYKNFCELEKAGVALDVAGPCGSPVVTSGGYVTAESLGKTTTMMDHGDMSHGTMDHSMMSGAVMTGSIDMSTPPPDASPTPSGSSSLEVPSGWTYVSDVFGYTVSFPKFTYYNVYRIGSEKGDVIVIDVTEEGVKSSQGGLVRVSYTKPGQIPPSDVKKTIAIKSGSLSLSYREPLSPRGQEIVDMIVATAQ